MKFDVEQLDEGFILQIDDKKYAVTSTKDLIRRIVDTLPHDEHIEETKALKKAVEETPEAKGKIIQLDEPCHICGKNEYIFTRHQGNRYGNFNIYRCNDCGMKRNVMDKKPEETNSIKPAMSERTKELQEIAKKMQAGQ